MMTDAHSSLTQDAHQRARCHNCGVKCNNTYQIIWRGNSDIALDILCVMWQSNHMKILSYIQCIIRAMFLVVIAGSVAAEESPSLNSKCLAGRSYDGSSKLTVSFVNNFSGPVEVVWLNYEGQQVSYGIIEPNQVWKQETMISHPWAFISPKTGNCIGYYNPKVGDDKKRVYTKGNTSEVIQKIQQRLNELGCNAGVADGIWGKRSRSAAVVFAKKAGLPTSGDNFISETFFEALANAAVGFCPKSKPKQQPKTPKVKAPAAVVTSAKSNLVYECDRVVLVPDGFTSWAAAESWFPKEAWIVYRPDGSYSASKFGKSIKRSTGDIKYGRSTIRGSGGLTIAIRHSDPNLTKSKLIIRSTWPGYQDVMPQIYSCGPGKNTGWWP